MVEAEKSNGTNAAALSPPSAFKGTAQTEKSALDATMPKVRPSSYGQRPNNPATDLLAKKYKFKGPSLVDRVLYKFVPSEMHYFKQLVGTAVLLSIFSMIGRHKR